MIELAKINAAYDKSQILFDISSRLRRDEFTCIIGKNGSGKSTLLRVIAGIISYKGSITLHGRELCTISNIERAKHLSYLPQIRPIPFMDVRTFISHGRYPHLGFSKTLSKKDHVIINHAAEVAGIEALLDRRIDTLSGGERQRAYIAMTVAQDAEMLLLDEPTAYLDIEHQLEVMELLARLHANGKGIIMAVHDLPQAFSYANRIILISNGSIVAQGTPDALCRSQAIQNTFGVALKQSAEPDELYSYRLLKNRNP